MEMIAITNRQQTTDSESVFASIFRDLIQGLFGDKYSTMNYTFHEHGRYFYEQITEQLTKNGATLTERDDGTRILLMPGAREAVTLKPSPTYASRLFMSIHRIAKHIGLGRRNLDSERKLFGKIGQDFGPYNPTFEYGGTTLYGPKTLEAKSISQ